MASFGHQIGLCRQFTYWTIFLPTTSHLCVNTSSLEPSLPGLNHTFMLNCARNSAHLACYHESFLEDVKYSKFLWLVTMSITSAEPSRKCCQFLNASNIANSSLSWVS